MILVRRSIQSDLDELGRAYLNSVLIGHILSTIAKSVLTFQICLDVRYICGPLIVCMVWTVRYMITDQLNSFESVIISVSRIIRKNRISESK